MEPFFPQDAWNRLVDQLERLPHALLLHGPQGVGKLCLAERFAQLLLCEAQERSATPCGRCDGCRWVLAGNHPDLRVVEPDAIARREAATQEGDDTEKPKGKPSAEIRIEQVRGLADFLNIGSHRGGRRIALVHPAEAMNPHAANALLKSLEEPPASAMFILVSHRPSRLLATVRSRCISVPVPLPAEQVARAWLEAQGVADAARRLAFAGGAPLRALDDAGSARGALADEILQALQSGDRTGLNQLKDREGLEVLAEVLQKYAYDVALGSFGLPPRYGVATARRQGNSREWLSYARRLGRDRTLARHPLNVGLHAASMLAGSPEK